MFQNFIFKCDRFNSLEISPIELKKRSWFALTNLWLPGVGEGVCRELQYRLSPNDLDQEQCQC